MPALPPGADLRTEPLRHRGCRLHAELGPMAKPAVCRQFPFVYAGPYVGIDPTCFHADPSADGDAPEPPFDVLVGAPPSHRPLPWGDLRHGHDVRAALTSAPLEEVAPRIGPLARSMVEPLLRAEPAPPEPVWFESRVRTALAFALVERVDAAGVLVGGCQLVWGAGLPPGQGFAAFMRLLHTGAVPDTHRGER
ncbi:MAG: hypothetical protein R3F61_38495 [Myxococcota bacterium]